PAAGARTVAREAARRGPGIRAAALEALAPRLRALGARGERCARMLEAAQRRGQTALAAAHATLQRTEPEHRREVERWQEPDEGVVEIEPVTIPASED